MSLTSEIKSAATEAQSNLAQTGGTQPGKKNSLYNGAAYLAVYGQPQVDNQMLPGGGYRQRTILTLTVTRAQFTTAPAARAKWTRTDVTPNLTYTIEKVGFHDACLYTVTLIRPGE